MIDAPQECQSLQNDIANRASRSCLGRDGLRPRFPQVQGAAPLHKVELYLNQMIDLYGGIGLLASALGDGAKPHSNPRIGTQSAPEARPGMIRIAHNPHGIQACLRYDIPLPTRFSVDRVNSPKPGRFPTGLRGHFGSCTPRGGSPFVHRTSQTHKNLFGIQPPAEGSRRTQWALRERRDSSQAISAPAPVPQFNRSKPSNGLLPVGIGINRL